MRRCHTLACLTVAGMAQAAVAGIIGGTGPEAERLPFGFEEIAAGERVTNLSFGDVSAVVTGEGRGEDRVVLDTDGFGAVASEGRRFWKLRGGTTTIRFDRQLASFGFWFSDLERGNIEIRFGSLGAERLAGRNPGRSTELVYRSPDGLGFDTVELSWISGSSDGIGLDGITATPLAGVPAPGAGVLLGAAVFGSMRSRRRQAR